jgi:hypothetical protein
MSHADDVYVLGLSVMTIWHQKHRIFLRRLNVDKLQLFQAVHHPITPPSSAVWERLQKKAVPLHAMGAHGGRGGIAPTHI